MAAAAVSLIAAATSSLFLCMLLDFSEQEKLEEITINTNKIINLVVLMMLKNAGDLPLWRRRRSAV